MVAHIIRGIKSAINAKDPAEIETNILNLSFALEEIKALEKKSKNESEDDLLSDKIIKFNVDYGDCYEFAAGSKASLHRIINAHKTNYDLEIPYPTGEELTKLCNLQKDVFELCSSEIFMANSKKFAQEFAKKQEEDQQKAPSNVIPLLPPKTPSASVAAKVATSLEQQQRAASM